MDLKIEVQSTVTFNSEIVIKKPPYMSMEELNSHINYAKERLGKSYTFMQLVIVLEDMGFDVKETTTDFVDKKELDQAHILSINKIEGDSY